MLKTNRDLYKSIAVLMKEQAERKLSLEQYLERILSSAKSWQTAESLSLDEFYAILKAGFSPPADSNTEDLTIKDERSGGYEGWRSTVCRQIKDLRDMKKKGSLKNDMKYFGIDAPSGNRWYNFDPLSFLECGTAGSFGGWDEDDDTGRQLVPGKVAAINALGETVLCDPQDLLEPVTEIARVTWDEFREFLLDGQCYE